MEGKSLDLKSLANSRRLMLAISLVGVYLISSGVSLAIFSFVLKAPALSINLGDLEKSRAGIASLPKTEECPINGAKFSKVERGIWESRRPIAAIIENHVDSRPPSGLSKADVVYEAVAEGGITRFLAIFYCGAASEDVKIAPVRSARVYYIDYAAEYGDKPIFMHVGGANNYSGSGDTAKEVMALELLETIGWRVAGGNDFDTIYDSGLNITYYEDGRLKTDTSSSYRLFLRDPERLDHDVASEHTMVASLDGAYYQAEKRGFGDKNEGVSWDKSFTPWKFIEDKAQGGSVSAISFGFWDNKTDYDVTWKYDATSNEYLRENGGKELIDLETKKQLTAKNVVIIFAKERGPVDRNVHMFYTTIGKGDALIFQNGKAIEATWEKDSRENRTKLFDENGREIGFVPGVIWLEIIPAGNTVNY